MTRDDYEAQKRRLDEQRRVLIEMAETAYQYQVRALDTVWRMMSGEGSGEILALPKPAAARPAAPSRRRMGPKVLYHDILKLLPQLPVPFIHADVSALLGYAADRGSLHRALLELQDNGYVAIHSEGAGRLPTRYRST